MPDKNTFRLTQKLLKGLRIDEDLYTLIASLQGVPSDGVFCGVNGVVGVEYRDDDGKPHRDDGPARYLIDGTETWFRHGEIHRGDGPAVVYRSGEEHWYQKGKLHRDGAPAIVSPDGAESWYRKGDCHRDDGPAITSAGGTSHQWWQRGYIVNEFVIEKKKKELEKDALIAELKEQLKSKE